jgi:uncharacterized protein (DUF2252 family)
MSTQAPSERARAGIAARGRVPLESLAVLSAADRAGPVSVLGAQMSSRLPELIPIRHARMMTSPFAFYRGAAAIMAGDLADTPTSGFDVRLCGDAHLANFGLFASAERALLFDINDFDESYPGPWEWDLKRLGASLVVAGQENGFTDKQTRKIVVAATSRYRDAMASFAAMGNLALWYSRIDVDELQRQLGPQLDARVRKRLDKSVAKARGHDHLRSLDKLTEVVEGQRRIIADPPLVVPVSQIAPGLRRDEVESTVQDILLGYAASLEPGHRALFSSYTFVDMARKVVGVGSVGTRCWIVLMRGRDDDDPLFLQVKEAQQSVLAPYLGESPHRNEGERVVTGQRIMQAAGDVFLGWHRITGIDGQDRDFYVRQLHDWKGSANVETMTPKHLRLYAEFCAWTLARAHARSGDRIAIAAYLGTDDDLPRAIADFAHAYAELNARDHAAFTAAVGAGELPGAVGSPT